MSHKLIENKKRKLKSNDDDQQPPLKKQKQELTVSRLSLGKGKKCVFCDKIRDHKYIILTTYCCHCKMCGYCITNNHNKSCLNCKEIVYARKYYQTMKEICIKVGKELKKPMYVYCIYAKTMIHKTRQNSNNNNIYKTLRNRNEDWLKYIFSPSFEGDYGERGLLWLRIVIMNFKARCERIDGMQWRHKYEQSIQLLIEKETSLGTDVTSIILDYIFEIQYTH